MPDYAKPGSTDRTIRSHGEQIRRIRTRRPVNADWPWYSLRPYLCGGWLDQYSLNPDRSDDFALAPEDAGDRCGFFDTGQALVFTGLLLWDPSSFWTSPPYVDSGNPLLQGSPEVYRDGIDLVSTRDGFGNSSVVQDWDRGYPLPYEIGTFGFALLRLPAFSSEMSFFGSSTSWLNGAWYHAVAERRSSSPLGVELGPTAIVGVETNGAAIDPAGFTHVGAPDVDTLYSLDGLVLRYESQLPTPTGYPGAPRSADAFFGVDLSGTS
jgi:hypothetical protein